MSPVPPIEHAAACRTGMIRLVPHARVEAPGDRFGMLDVHARITAAAVRAWFGEDLPSAAAYP